MFRAPTSRQGHCPKYPIAQNALGLSWVLLPDTLGFGRVVAVVVRAEQRGVPLPRRVLCPEGYGRSVRSILNLEPD